METMTNPPEVAGAAATYIQVGSPAQIGLPAQIGSTLAYVRCANHSSGGQELQKQTAEVLAVAAEHGLDLKAENVIAEYGSGATAKRPGLTALLKQIQSGEVSGLVVTSLDRLWRSNSAGCSISDVLVAHGVTVVTSDHTFHLGRAEDAARWRWCCMPTRDVSGFSSRGRRVARRRRG